MPTNDPLSYLPPQIQRQLLGAASFPTPMQQWGGAGMLASALFGGAPTVPFDPAISIVQQMAAPSAQMTRDVQHALLQQHVAPQAASAQGGGKAAYQVLNKQGKKIVRYFAPGQVPHGAVPLK